MVNSKENYKFDLGVKGLNVQLDCPMEKREQLIKGNNNINISAWRKCIYLGKLVFSFFSCQYLIGA